MRVGGEGGRHAEGQDRAGGDAERHPEAPVRGPHQERRQHSAEDRQRGLGRRPSPQSHGDGEDGRQQGVVGADLAAVVQRLGLHRKVELVERDEPGLGELVVDVEVAVLEQAQGRQQVLGLVGGGEGAVGSAGRDGDHRPGGHHDADDRRGTDRRAEPRSKPDSAVGRGRFVFSGGGRVASGWR